MKCQVPYYDNTSRVYHSSIPKKKQHIIENTRNSKETYEVEKKTYNILYRHKKHSFL